jgi:hypothetical protein
VTDPLIDPLTAPTLFRFTRRKLRLRMPLADLPPPAAGGADRGADRGRVRRPPDDATDSVGEEACSGDGCRRREGLRYGVLLLVEGGLLSANVAGGADTGTWYLYTERMVGCFNSFSRLRFRLRRLPADDSWGTCEGCDED